MAWDAMGRAGMPFSRLAAEPLAFGARLLERGWAAKGDWYMLVWLPLLPELPGCCPGGNICAKAGDSPAR